MSNDRKKRAVVLLSGGLDSATTLAMAVEAGYECYALSVSYGQRHVAELNAASRIAQRFHCQDHKVIDIDLSAFGGSALTDDAIDVPIDAPTDVSESLDEGIPVTYVPARNTIMLSVALGWAEVLDAQAIFTGVNAVDYSGYPDCRPDYIAAFSAMANLATKAGVEGHGCTIETPLIHLTKADIIQRGMALGVDYAETVSCYQADEGGAACGKCDSCRLRIQGFVDAGVSDPTRYQT